MASAAATAVVRVAVLGLLAASMVAVVPGALAASAASAAAAAAPTSEMTREEGKSYPRSKLLQPKIEVMAIKKDPKTVQNFPGRRFR